MAPVLTLHFSKKRVNVAKLLKYTRFLMVFAVFGPPLLNFSLRQLSPPPNFPATAPLFVFIDFTVSDKLFVLRLHFCVSKILRCDVCIRVTAFGSAPTA